MHLPPDLLRRCWFLAGPTACGKTAAALELAERIDAEIVALDSMSLYRGMDVGTAKATADEQRRVPHHLIDVLDPHEEFSLAEYVAAARTACEAIVGRGRTPLFVGGTGLYLRGVLRGVFEGPAADWELRRRLDAEAASLGPEALHARLAAIDPPTAARLHPNDQRRIVRAIEVFELTGRPLSEQQRQDPLSDEERPPHVEWLSPPRGWLRERIDRRVVRMYEQGLVAEVERLLARDRPLGRTARQALGYKEIVDALEAGRDPATALGEIQIRTRQFAKRQHTWFRNLAECRAVTITGDETAAELAERLVTGV
jgi:tRNA dimethylallyltransferase